MHTVVEAAARKLSHRDKGELAVPPLGSASDRCTH